MKLPFFDYEVNHHANVLKIPHFTAIFMKDSLLQKTERNSNVILDHSKNDGTH